ncbi:hypothetical protein ABZY36_25010 [Streptomyces sp. NPDC006627]|uniref:hypothetical protein n=1 Tax=Streptomyces sp. NPDC006627 TaxID=3154679 RepID=UPI0033BCA462
MTWRVVRWAPLVAVGVVWWWGVLRLALAPDAGALEGAVAAGGWGLSLLPVHCVPKGRAEGRARGAGASGVRARSASWRAGAALKRAEATSRRARRSAWRERAAGVRWRATKAWRRRRSGGGSGPS